MNNKENAAAVAAAGELSAEQRSRISQSFRAAKARLALKRPRPEDRKEMEILNRVEVPQRLPLSGISTNTSSEAFPRVCKLPKKSGEEIKNEMDFTPVRQAEGKGKLCSMNSNADGKIEGFHIEKTCHTPEYMPISNGNSVESLGTPRSNDLLTSDFLNDDFDESILEQIDAICEQIPCCNSEREYTTKSILENKNPWADTTKSTSENTNPREDTTKSTPESENPWKDISVQIDGICDQACVELESCKLVNNLTENMPEQYAKYIQSLNDRQKEAACSDTSIPLMIVAGPGSGKTSTMVGRVLMLLHQGVNPCNILAMTFTTAAATEMRERIGTVAGKAAAKELTISTFHSFSLQLCRLHAEKLERTPEFLIYGHGQQRRAVIDAVRMLEDGKKKANPELCKLTEAADIDSSKTFKDQAKKWLKFVTQAKCAGRSPEDFRKIGDDTGAMILENYNNILKSCNALDYHDFISCSVKLLTDFSEVFEECQNSWKAIVIDEFQDTSTMQYVLLQVLASHKRVTIVGDDDQSIFSFNGADVSGFDSFRKDFPMYKEVKLNKNYRSTRCIIEAASCLIRHNSKRNDSKDILTDNSSGSKIIVKECCNEEAQCAFVVDKILENTPDDSSAKSLYGNIAVLYRRQVTGKIFQTAFRNRKIPFNVHGVAFYRKKVVRAIIAMLSTTLPGCDDSPFRRVFKALLPFDKEEKNKVIEHIDKVSTVRKCTFIAAARDVFSAKVSGTFKRSQLTQGRKVLLTLDMILKLVYREQSISAVINSVANMIPQKYLLEQQAVLDTDGRKLLNEDNDLRSVLHYLLDDVSSFFTTVHKVEKCRDDNITEGKGCMSTLKAFIDYISEREKENFRLRRHDNQDSVTLTTIHQANDAEIPLLHEYNGIVNENANSVEEERRLFYVAMTRARKKLFMLFVIMDSNWQVLQPSRFLREIPCQLLEMQGELDSVNPKKFIPETKQEADPKVCNHFRIEHPEGNGMQQAPVGHPFNEASKEFNEPEKFINNNFLQRFSAENRAIVSHMFHQWAKKPAFHDPKRLISKVAFVVDERLRAKKCTHKEVLRELKSSLTSDEAIYFAESVIRWEQIPAEKRTHLMREKQEHFQKLRVENAMSSSEPTAKQISYLQKLGCTKIPTSRLHASRLIEEYKSL